MGKDVTERAVPGLHVVDLRTITPVALESLWQREAHWWREHLRWDIADAQAALRRVVERGGVPGKAIQVGAQMAGYAYYVIAGRLGVLAGFSVAPEWSIPEVGRPLLQATLDAIRQHGVPRIESQCIPIDCPWLSAALEPQGFQPYWREVLRLDLQPMPAPVPPRDHMHLEPWQGTHLREAAAIMQAAYAKSPDADMNTFYRTVEGCRLVLDHLLNQGGGGRPVTAASALVRHRGQGIGCIVITETALHQSHLVQVAVLPAYQRHGVGRWLLHYSLSQLAAHQYETLSLLVSRANHRALTMYHAMGFHAVLSYPVFVWDRSEK